MSPRTAPIALCICLAALDPAARPAAGAAFPAGWPQEYLDALAETSGDATPGEVSRALVAIVPGESPLAWDAAGERVRVSTWTDDSYYPVHYRVGDVVTVSAAHLVWTAVPGELTSWVAGHAFPEADLAARLKQLYGMPPDADKTLFVEFWVRPSDLFRPSPDPEVTDREALMDFADSPYLAVDPAYVAWFNDLRLVSYTGDTAHPWTRLGYTFDWGNPYNHFGVSEFVIGAGAQAEIASMTPTAAYAPVSPTVIDFGRSTATAGDHIVISACATLPQAPASPLPSTGAGAPCDAYVLVVAPSGGLMSLLPGGAMAEGYRPYASSLRGPGRVCATVLDYAVPASLPTGEWTAAAALLPAGAAPVPAHVLSYAEATVLILRGGPGA